MLRLIRRNAMTPRMAPTGAVTYVKHPARESPKAAAAMPSVTGVGDWSRDTLSCAAISERSGARSGPIGVSTAAFTPP